MWIFISKGPSSDFIGKNLRPSAPKSVLALSIYLPFYVCAQQEGERERERCLYAHTHAYTHIIVKNDVYQFVDHEYFL